LLPVRGVTGERYAERRANSNWVVAGLQTGPLPIPENVHFRTRPLSSTTCEARAGEHNRQRARGVPEAGR
jgi:hypothetical protein